MCVKSALIHVKTIASGSFKVVPTKAGTCVRSNIVHTVHGVGTIVVIIRVGGTFIGVNTSNIDLVVITGITFTIFDKNTVTVIIGIPILTLTPTDTFKLRPFGAVILELCVYFNSTAVTWLILFPLSFFGSYPT
jgi:hypothetical protein